MHRSTLSSQRVARTVRHYLRELPARGSVPAMAGSPHRVAMLMLHGTPRDDVARRDLARVLDGAEVGEPDEVGAFEITLDAEDQEEALHTVWNAIAATGTDDHILFLEHPELPEHWRSRAQAPSSG